jgi:lipopolysaccharide/colanic/teichoic acid biosynthesis glycosyltransferase
MADEGDVEFELDEHGRVWMILAGDCHLIGRREAVCGEMRRFLAAADAAADAAGGLGAAGGD